MTVQDEDLQNIGTRMQNKQQQRQKMQQKEQKQRGPKSFLKMIFAVVLIIGLLVGYEYASGYLGTPSLISLLSGLGGKNQVNVMLVGTDNRGSERARADTIVLVNVNFKSRDINLLSIPRDTRASIPGRGDQKINHAHAYGGIELLEKTVEGLIGTPIDYYIETDFKGFEKIIDYLGGINLEVEKRMYYPEEDINLKTGVQNLNGHDALAYVRFRSDGLGDIGRVKRQQKFFKAAFEQYLSLKTLAKAPQIIGELTDCVNTNLPASVMLRVANTLKGADLEQLQTHVLPGHSQTINGLSYWIADVAEMRQQIALITNKQ